VSAPKPHWICRLLGHRYRQHDAGALCSRCGDLTQEHACDSCGAQEHAIERVSDGSVLRRWCRNCALNSFAALLALSTAHGRPHHQAPVDFFVERLEGLRASPRSRGRAPDLN
jgi:hypothetical protein